MNKTMYEVNWHRDGETFVRCSVTPITVTRLGILEGCSAPTIDAIDINGRRFAGNPDEYFETEEMAWANIRQELLEGIAGCREEMETIAKDIRGMEAFLAEMNTKKLVQA
jgi:hypothetical protein